MNFQDERGQPVEINFQTFGSVLPETRRGLTHVRLKDGREVWVKAAKDAIVEASAEE